MPQEKENNTKTQNLRITKARNINLKKTSFEI